MNIENQQNLIIKSEYEDDSYCQYLDLEVHSNLNTYLDIDDITSQVQINNQPIKIQKKSRVIKKKYSKIEIVKPYSAIIKELVEIHLIQNEKQLRELLKKGVFLKHCIEYYNLKGNCLNFSRLQGELKRYLEGSNIYRSREDNKNLIIQLLQNVNTFDGKFDYSEAIKKQGDVFTNQSQNYQMEISRRTCHRHIAQIKGKGLKFLTSQKKDLYNSYPENRLYQKIIELEPHCQRLLLQLKKKGQILDQNIGVQKNFLCFNQTSQL